MNTEFLLNQIKAQKAWAVTHRRYLHQYPELSLQEQNTSAYCKKILADLGYEIKPCFEQGFIAELNIPAATKRIAFRAEMDALPIQEQNQHEFVSQNKGVAHMCGHDVHMAVALFTAKILAEFKALLSCNVRFVFQPSEEELPGGAKGMIAKGCLAGVDEIYGLHTTAQAEVGEFWIREGAFMGTSSPFTIEIIGKGCHAAKPEEGLNPIHAAAELINIWKEIPAKLKTEHAPILSVTMIESGNTNNVIPSNLKMQGALRAFSSEDLKKIQKTMRESLKAFEAKGFQFELSFQQSYNCVVNQPYGLKRVLDAAQKIPGLFANQSIAPMRFVEDFCYYLEERPGAFYFLGGGNKAKNICSPLHSPAYDVDEEALVIGASLMSLIALDLK